MNTSKLKSGGLTMMLFMLVLGAHAHALWIHTASNSEIGKTHPYKIYYADYQENAIEPVAKWYSDVKEFELWLISPSGKKTKLEPTATETYFQGSFTPEEEGEYRMQISHTADPGESKTAYQFNAYAQIWVGKGKASTQPVSDLALVRNAKSSDLQVLYKGEALPEGELAILGPDAETQELKTSKKGKVKVDLDGKGTYFAEATHTEKLPENDPSGLKAIWRCATQAIEIE
ncbi:DUF4198 domain-containing protein [Algoriphagus halophytocola]|uniref:DUF4198 domain-containing protein n=1 Tax=Algoriphagus halophytocola TaxID=2991499 RepID=A0ABY6MGF1_9BACT|nr:MULTISPECIES: DUF4198 domain-containing protein [unclassified Algoriphagus]UZD22883.1 DUF4198 domain-containing protein [Algoriphagus sp. TR-M5]WBL44150.1 DUF4198 domain-containing protein [Algoriphagus sp. TR-M9]